MHSARQPGPASFAIPDEMQLGTAATSGVLRYVHELLETERRRIAQTLHDEAGQLLTAVHLELGRVERKAPPECRASFDEIRTLLDRMELQLRHLSHELRPVILDDFGLLPALQFLVDSVSERTGISVTLRTSAFRQTPPMLETAIYRIVQEALTNVSRHSRATQATVHLSGSENTLQCAIRDDGIGFDNSALRAGGLGLRGIRAQAESVGGHVSIHSVPGSGTEIVAVIPASLAAEPAFTG